MEITENQYESMIHVLQRMSDDVYEVNTSNGWFEEDRTFGDEIALLHSEVSEMLEAYRDYGFVDVTNRHPEQQPNPKPEGVGSEAADVLIRLLDICRRRNINLAFEFKRKLEYNVTRGYKHGGKSL